MFLLKPLEKIIYTFRDIFWEYPDFMLFGENSMRLRFEKFYSSLRPFSHIVSSVTVLAILTVIFTSDYQLLVRADTTTLIEGVLVGVDETGKKNTIQKLNPLVISNTQIEKDLNELIYESLVSVDVYGNVKNQLAETIAPNQTGDNFRIKLREDVYWHDHTDQKPHRLTARDVEATFKLLEELDFNSSTKTIYSRIANKRIKFVPIEGDDFRFEFQLDGAIPNFYELITFKILPETFLQELDANNILTSEPLINRNPIGTGRYKLAAASEDQIQLTKNTIYYNKGLIPKINDIKFRFFIDEESIIDALENGQIHSVAGISTSSLSQLKDDANITLHRTGTIFTQYYALYLNLGDTGPEVLKDVKIRRAISSAVNRDYIIEILEGEAEEALGPIGSNSFAFAKDLGRYRFNLENANKLLDEAGWKYEEGAQFRSKDGKLLEMNLIALDNIDRNKVSQSIVEDLRGVGISMNLVKKPIQDLNLQNVLPRNFDILLYSATTFIDPDRYELFHSAESKHPGLNLASFKSVEETLKIVRTDGKRETVKVPEADLRLEQGRSILDPDARKEEYFEFQRIVANEQPVVFLYHPILNYAVNNRVRNIDISDANTLEERFKNIHFWEIKL